MEIKCSAKEQEKLLYQISMSDCDYCLLKSECLNDDKYLDCGDAFLGEIQWIIVSEF